MIKMTLIIWVVILSICVILMGLIEIGKRIIKRLRKNNPPASPELQRGEPKKSRPEDDDNSWIDPRIDLH